MPLARVMSGVSGLPVAPLRSTPWQPAQRSKKICAERLRSSSVSGGRPPAADAWVSATVTVLGAPWYFASGVLVPALAASWVLPPRVAATWSALMLPPALPHAFSA